MADRISRDRGILFCIARRAGERFRYMLFESGGSGSARMPAAIILSRNDNESNLQTCRIACGTGIGFVMQHEQGGGMENALRFARHEEEFERSEAIGMQCKGPGPQNPLHDAAAFAS
jgi:hypothetical protein